MKALVYHGPGNKSWDDVPEPTIDEPTDAIVKVETTTICGTDLHILKGDVPTVEEGRILGHEGVGVVTEVGPGCTTVKVGDRVIISCISKCMTCDYCTSGLTSHCQTLGGIGWIFGHLIDGTQAEYVRVPFADNGLDSAPRWRHGRARLDAQRHSADRLRDRCLERCGQGGRRRCRRRRRPRRARRRDDRRRAGRGQGHSSGRRQVPSRGVAAVRRHGHRGRLLQRRARGR